MQAGKLEQNPSSAFFIPNPQLDSKEFDVKDKLETHADEEDFNIPMTNRNLQSIDDSNNCKFKSPADPLSEDRRFPNEIPRELPQIFQCKKQSDHYIRLKNGVIKN